MAGIGNKIYKSAVALGSSIVLMDTIEHEGKFWLVPQWFESKTEEWMMPVRIICLATLRHRDLRNNPKSSTHFAVNVPIPKSVLDGVVPPQEAAGYLIVENPDIRYRKPSSLH